MAKDINLLQQVFNKSWKFYDEQFSHILQEAATIFEWMNEVVPAAEEAINRKTACNLPKTPHIKRRKIDEPQKKQIDQDQTCSTSDDNGEMEIVEAKRPRQLRPRRNTKATNRRSSKGLRKQYQKKAVSQATRASRVTRASYKKDPSTYSVVDKDISTNEDECLDDDNISDTAESNTTKSFIEHEKDIGCTDGIKEITSKCLAVSLDDVLDKEGTSKKPVDIASCVSTIKNYDKAITTESTVEKEAMLMNDGTEEPKGALEIAKHPTETEKSQSLMGTVITRVENRTQESSDDEKNVKISHDQKVPSDDRNEKTDNGDIDCKVVAYENNKGAFKGDTGLAKNVESLSKICPQGQIAKIKERLFEKITVSSSGAPTRQSPQRMAGRQSPQQMAGRQSPRLMAGRQSPQLTAGRQSPQLTAGRQSPQLGKYLPKVATPKELWSPVTKQKLVEQNIFDEKMEILSKEEQEDEIVSTEEINNGNNEVDNEKEESNSENLPQKVGPKIIKPIKPKNLLTGVHTMIKAANQKTNVINQATVTKQGNIVTGLFSFLKSNTIEKKTETIQERKQRMEDEAKKREEARMKLIQQAEQRKQKEIEERKKRRQEREQRVAEVQAKKAQEEKEKQEQTQKRFEMMKKNEEKLRKIKEKEEELKKRIREKKMAEAEAKRKQEENERLAKMAEKEEEEKRKAEYLQRKQEYEEMERKRKIEEQKKAEEQRHEEHAREKQLQEERLRREIEEREAQVRKRLEEKERELKELQDRRKIEKEREEQERLKKEEQEKMKREMLEREKAEKERIERELEERQKKEIEAKENDRKMKEEREIQERKELKAAKEKEIRDREAYFRKKLEQKQFGEPKRTFDKAELEMRQPLMKSPAQPVSHAMQQKGHMVQCTSYNTPTLTRVTSQKKKQPSLQNYDINSLSEDDSTDDEEDPAQEIPSWAKGTAFKRAILAQTQSNIDPRGIFVNMLEAPKLEKMFPKLRARFFKRTSSACWDHPPRPFKTMLH